MQTVSYQFVVEKKPDGTVKAHNSVLYVPKAKPVQSEMKWYEDKYKK